MNHQFQNIQKDFLCRESEFVVPGLKDNGVELSSEGTRHLSATVPH